MSCGCESESGGVRVIETSNNPMEAIEVRGEGDLFFTKLYEPGKIVWLGRISEYTPPQISAPSNPIKEVGAVVDFSWMVNIDAGREPITSKSIDPVPVPAPNMDLPFEVAVTGKKSTTRQTVLYHTVSVSDGEQTVTRQLSILFRNKVHLLFTYKDGVTAGQEITAADIGGATSTLADNIKSVYGGLKNYAIPSAGLLQYIFWIYESGSTPINSIVQNGLPFPLLFIPGVISVVNPHDAAISSNFSLVRSVNKFGNGALSLDML